MHRAVRVLLLLALLGTSGLGCRSGTNRAELEPFAERWKVLYNSHDLPGFTALYAPNGAYMAPGMVFFVRSPPELRTGLEKLWRAYPDMRITNVHSLVAGGDSVAFAWELVYTTPAKAKQTLRGATFIVLEDDRIVQQLTVTSR